MTAPRRWVFLLCWMVCGVEWSVRPASGLSVAAEGGSITTPSPPSDLEAETLPPTVYTSEPERNSDRDVMENLRRVRREEECKIVNATESVFGLQEIEEVNYKSVTFFVRPKKSFKRLVFRMKLQSILDISDIFYTEKAIDLHNSDLQHSKEPEPWTRVEVEYYENSSRGPNSHALRVTAGNTTLSMVTDYWWLLYTFEGFIIYAEGDAQLLFNCLPTDLQETHALESSFDGVWLMGGLFITAGLLLLALFSVWMCSWCRRRQQTIPSPPSSPVYDEFDEEVLEKIREKVEALRGGKSQSDLSKTGVVHYHPHNENPYVMEVLVQKESSPKKTSQEEFGPERHIYQNAYSVRPTPAQRNLGTSPTPTDTHYHNLSSLSSSLEATIDGDATDQDSGATVEAQKGPYQNLPHLANTHGLDGDRADNKLVKTTEAAEGPYHNLSSLVSPPGKVADRDCAEEN